MNGTGTTELALLQSACVAGTTGLGTGGLASALAGSPTLLAISSGRPELTPQRQVLLALGATGVRTRVRVERREVPEPANRVPEDNRPLIGGDVEASIVQHVRDTGCWLRVIREIDGFRFPARSVAGLRKLAGDPASMDVAPALWPRLGWLLASTRTNFTPLRPTYAMHNDELEPAIRMGGRQTAEFINEAYSRDKEWARQLVHRNWDALNQDVRVSALELLARKPSAEDVPLFEWAVARELALDAKARKKASPDDSPTEKLRQLGVVGRDGLSRIDGQKVKQGLEEAARRAFALSGGPAPAVSLLARIKMAVSVKQSPTTAAKLPEAMRDDRIAAFFAGRQTAFRPGATWQFEISPPALGDGDAVMGPASLRGNKGKLVTEWVTRVAARLPCAWWMSIFGLDEPNLLLAAARSTYGEALVTGFFLGLPTDSSKAWKLAVRHAYLAMVSEKERADTEVYPKAFKLFDDQWQADLVAEILKATDHAPDIDGLILSFSDRVPEPAAAAFVEYFVRRAEAGKPDRAVMIEFLAGMIPLGSLERLDSRIRRARVEHADWPQMLDWPKAATARGYYDPRVPPHARTVVLIHRLFNVRLSIAKSLGTKTS